ncbi:MAG: hypothetical protein KJZ86_22400 [Caldilineaceae bacterium]|nr:hypothetical protein [Caldilineaceae bacterium]
MPIGSTFPAEWYTTTDPQTGRSLRRLTSAPAFSYPLYYFVDSITPDNRYLIFHSERGGWVQLYRLDLESGEITQLSDGRTVDSGWAIWCEQRVRGVYAHLAALNGVGREVWYFQDEELRATHLETLENRRVYDLAGRVPIGQSGFSPDGRHYAFIHADRAQFAQALAEREALQVMRQPFDFQPWRNALPCTVGLIDTATGIYRDVKEIPFHVHHVFFLDNQRLLLNHVQGENGMWSMRIDGSDERVLRPRSEGNGAICHNVITERGIFYEANGDVDGQREVWIGRYDLADDSFVEARLPGVGYVHTGRDPAGLANFFENQMGSEGHQLLWVHNAFDPKKQRVEVLRALTPIVRGQRYHAHPFLGPERRWLYFVEVLDGFSQICSLDVADLTL